MSFFAIRQTTLAVLLLVGSQLYLQAQSTSSGTTELTTTSAIVGVSSTQSVRLNVLNLQPVVSGVTAVACPVTLEFYDDSGALLKQTSFTTVSPSTAVNLVFKPTVSSTAANARAQVRAVVLSPIPTVTPVISSGTSTVTIAAPSCSLFSSFEVTDDATGNTQVLTSDFRGMPSIVVVPAALPK
jgi:hypothetical protein